MYSYATGAVRSKDSEVTKREHHDAWIYAYNGDLLRFIQRRRRRVYEINGHCCV